MPFKSEKQRRYLFANEPEIAKDWTETYGSKIKKAYGGRIGYYSGGQSIPSEYTVEDARKTAMQDRLGGITEVMKQADLYRQGDIGQMYMANGGITRLGYRYGGDTMGGPNDRSSKSGASAPAGGASAGGNYGGNRNPDQSYGGGDVGSLGITGAQPANVFTDVTKEFLNPQKDYFTQTYSGQPNFLGLGGGYRTLKTPNDAGSNYRSRLNPIGLMSLLGRSFSMPFTLAASGFNSLRDTLGTGINTLRNKFGPAFNMFKDSGNFQEFLKKRKAAQYEDAIATDNLYDPNARIQDTSFEQDYNVPYYLDEFNPEGLALIDTTNLYDELPPEEETQSSFLKNFKNAPWTRM